MILLLNRKKVLLHFLKACSLLLLIALIATACSKEENEEEITVLQEVSNTNTDTSSAPVDTTKTPNSRNSFIDARDGNGYTFVSIGSQVWMAENLKYLPAVVPSDSSSFKVPLYYVYGYQGNDTAAAKATDNYRNYGVLYNFSAAAQGGALDPEIPNQIKGVCPEGWHLPTDAEWTQLTDYLGGRPFAGGKLKATDTTFWKSPNTAATNETGFTALPAGFRASNNKFEDIRKNAFFWSATENGANLAWFRNMSHLYGDVYRIDFFKESALCVRCIRD
ncbi:MAG: FISUMP domain-containing protein [Vicingaceae bacterium]